MKSREDILNMYYLSTHIRRMTYAYMVALISFGGLACQPSTVQWESTDSESPMTPPQGGNAVNLMIMNQSGIEATGGETSSPVTEETINPLIPRPTVQSCTLPTPPPAGEMELLPATQHRFTRPLWYGMISSYPALEFVAEKGGRVYAWDESTGRSPEIFIEIDVSRGGSEEGLLAVAFHPSLNEHPLLFTYYSSKTCTSPQVSRCTHLTKWTLNMGATPSVDLSSEVKLLEVPQPYANHNGGDLRFGPDGYLYLSLGDGGSANDPIGHAQNTSTLLGSVLRIDIDRPDPQCGVEYSVPEDNPFSSNRCGTTMGGLPEIWAWGLRNTWRMSFDRQTGALWGADVGQDAWEEVNIIEGGKNYGWKWVEGEVCAQSGCDPSAYEAPIHTYGHDVGESITGGFVYRGQEIPSLVGYYVFADFDLGKVMAFPLSDPSERVVLTERGLRFTSFGETLTGELRILTFDTPSLLKLRPLQTQQAQVQIPQRLSETGCFSDLPTGVLAPSVVPYSINHPFWSDHAEKERGFAIPVDSQIIASPAGEGYLFPRESVLIKTFYLTSLTGERRRFETRLMHHSERGWIGYVYRWNEAQTDATLMNAAEEVTYEGPKGQQTWAFLSQSDCIKCHTFASNQTLGLEESQLNRRVSVEGGTYHQLEAWKEAGYLQLDRPINFLNQFPSADPTAETERSLEDVSIDEEARIYLHINCASCHRPDGVPTVDLDLRFDTPLAQMKVCGIAPTQGDLEITDAMLLSPGEPSKSLLLKRLSIRGEKQMPPMGSNLVDNRGAALISLWISSVLACP